MVINTVSLFSAKCMGDEWALYRVNEEGYAYLLFVFDDEVQDKVNSVGREIAAVLGVGFKEGEPGSTDGTGFFVSALKAGKVDEKDTAIPVIAKAAEAARNKPKRVKGMLDLCCLLLRDGVSESDIGEQVKQKYIEAGRGEVDAISLAHNVLHSAKRELEKSGNR